MKALRNYAFPLLLIGSIVCGALIGSFAPSVAVAVRPVGELFLNLIFMVLVPLVFLTVSSSIASLGGGTKLSRLTGSMVLVFVLTSAIAAVGAMLFMLVFSPAPAQTVGLGFSPRPEVPSLLDQVVRGITVSDFAELLSKKNMLPLVIFAVAFGLATMQLGDKGQALSRVLSSGASVCLRLVDYAMYVAPLGLFAYFANTVVDTGQHLAAAYVRVFWIYYAFAAIYFFVGFTLYAFAAGRMPAIKRFWSNALQPSLTAVGTCSSLATLPVTLEAAPAMGVPAVVRDLVIPVGAALHKDGSVIGGVLKILFLFGVFHQQYSPMRLLAVVGVAILVGVVMGAIPSGGLVGEMLILSVFGFPPEALPLIAVISVLIDPAATLLNAIDDLLAAMLVTRLTYGNVWADSSRERTRSIRPIDFDTVL